MKVVILCGGFGTRFREETERKPKPMIEIGYKPILWHIMKTYSAYGFNEFILCLGYKGDIIKDYFLNFKLRNNNFTIDLDNNNITLHNSNTESNWKVTLVNTGKDAMTGARIKRVEKYITDNIFMVTYGDGVTNLNINKLLEFHKSHGKIGTVTGTYPPSHYGELQITGDTVCSFKEKPQDNHSGIISGGYFIFNREFFNYLSKDDACMLEREPIERLAKDGQLKVYHHKGFWQCMDTYRDYTFLQKLWETGDAPWKIW